MLDPTKWYIHLLVVDLIYLQFRKTSPQITQIDADDISKVWVFICVICVICGQDWVGGWIRLRAAHYAVTSPVSRIQHPASVPLRLGNLTDVTHILL